MKRTRVEGTQLNSWEDVDGALQKIGIINRALTEMETGQNARIDGIKKEIKEAAKPLQEQKAGLEGAIKEFCECNRMEFLKVKTKVLTFGEVGFRLSTKIIIKRVAETLQSLKDYGHNLCIRIIEEPDKEAMKKLTDEQLAEVGASRKTDNTFGYTINEEKLREVA